MFCIATDIVVYEFGTLIRQYLEVVSPSIGNLDDFSSLCNFGFCYLV